EWMVWRPGEGVFVTFGAKWRGSAAAAWRDRSGGAGSDGSQDILDLVVSLPGPDLGALVLAPPQGRAAKSRVAARGVCAVMEQAGNAVGSAGEGGLVQGGGSVPVDPIYGRGRCDELIDHVQPAVCRGSPQGRDAIL